MHPIGLSAAHWSGVRTAILSLLLSIHRAILDAIENHDLDGAEKAMALHVNNARDAFFEYM